MTETTLQSTPVNVERIDDLDGEKKTRWFRVYVNIFDDYALFDGDPYSRVTAWMWLIANAAWKTKKINHKGKIIELQRGQVLVGRAFLAKKWKWSEKKVRTFLALLESDNMIEMGQSNGHFANIATICNYGKYQDVPRIEDQSKGQSRASGGPEQGQTITKNTNNKKTTMRAREAVVDKPPRSNSQVWADLINGKPNPAVHTHIGVTVADDGSIAIHNEFKKFWLQRFDGNRDRLEMALLQAAGFVQPNSNKPLEAQVGAQLARIVSEKMDRDQRYAKAKNLPAKSFQPDFRSQLEAI